ncbi:hypothetical protein [Pontimicrobium sp. SW4]|uniref:Leucine-rich repeat domain-containing protein n=1 Tax=Pontimicrobium sp. SW4 TaxID=3153519 RepID=A0AAU7BXM8_9FLAO
MKKLSYLFLVFTLLIVSCNERNVIIPDINFKNALLSSNYVDTDGDGKGDATIDLNGDNEIQINEIESVKFLNVSSKNIESLEGIEGFVNLEKLDCHDNQLKNLDVVNNKELVTLYCYDNQIENLDLIANKKLKVLGCRGNLLTSLNLSKNSNLEVLYGYNNRLTSLNLKNGNNSKMRAMFAHGNEYLKCIEVDDMDAIYPSSDVENYKGWCKDDYASYVESCDN